MDLTKHVFDRRAYIARVTALERKLHHFRHDILSGDRGTNPLTRAFLVYVGDRIEDVVAENKWTAPECFPGHRLRVPKQTLWQYVGLADAEDVRVFEAYTREDWIYFYGSTQSIEYAFFIKRAEDALTSHRYGRLGRTYYRRKIKSLRLKQLCVCAKFLPPEQMVQEVLMFVRELEADLAVGGQGLVEDLVDLRELRRARRWLAEWRDVKVKSE